MIAVNCQKSPSRRNQTCRDYGRTYCWHKMSFYRKKRIWRHDEIRIIYTNETEQNDKTILVLPLPSGQLRLVAAFKHIFLPLSSRMSTHSGPIDIRVFGDSIVSHRVLGHPRSLVLFITMHRQFCIVIDRPPFERTLLLLINAGMSLNVGSFSLFLLPYAFDPYTFRSTFRSNDKTTIDIYTKWYCLY